MARVRCQLCGGYVYTNKGNYMEVDGKDYHKKCVEKEKVPKGDTEAYKRLRSTIRDLCVCHDRPVNWGLIGKQIKDLLLEGFSYEDQLYALQWLYEHDGNVFWGYGRVRKFIYHAMEHKRKKEKADRRMQEAKQVKKQSLQQIRMPVSKPSFLPR